MGNGKIALLIFGRVADVQRGVLKLAETGANISWIHSSPCLLAQTSPETETPLVSYLAHNTPLHKHPGGKGHVASGVDLIFSRFHNKGVVGVALQYYGTAIAFLVAHYASDSGGRKRWERRDEVRARMRDGSCRAGKRVFCVLSSPLTLVE